MRKKRANGKIEQTWALVESVRTERGPRQRVVSYLGNLAAEVRQGVRHAAMGTSTDQPSLFADSETPQWVEVDLSSLRVERTLQFGGPWLGHEVLDLLRLPEVLAAKLPCGREEIPWAVMAEVLILARLIDPSSELYLAEHLYTRTALADVLGVPWTKINDDRLYRALDQLLPHKETLEKHLKARAGDLFDLCYDLLLYDVTSTYIQLTQAEAAFCIQKSDLQLRPIWHQTMKRVQAHILVCFLAYVAWKTLELMAKTVGLGDEPRRIWDELSQIMLVDVVLRTREGVEIRKRCVAQPTSLQAELLQRL